MDLTSKLIAGGSNGHFSFESLDRGLNSINSILGYMQNRGLSMESDTLGLRTFVRLNREGLPDWVVDMSGESFESQSSTKKNFLVRAYEWLMGKLKQFWNWLTGNKKTYDEVTAKADAEFEKSKTAAASISNAVKQPVSNAVIQDANDKYEKRQKEKLEELLARASDLNKQTTPESKDKLKETKEKISELEGKVKKAKSVVDDLVPSIKWFRAEPAPFSSFKIVISEFEQRIVGTIDDWNAAISEISNATSVDKAEAVSVTPYLHPYGRTPNKYTVELTGVSSISDALNILVDTQNRLRPKIEKFRKDLRTATEALYKRMDADAAKLKASLTVDDTEARDAINKQISTMRSLISLGLNGQMSTQSDNMLLKCAALVLYYNLFYRPKSQLDH